MTHKHTLFNKKKRNLNAHAQWSEKERESKKKTKETEKWEKGENANSRRFMNRKRNLNKVVAHKNMDVCMRALVCVCLCNMHVRPSVSKCSVCENTGGLMHIAARPMHLYTLKTSVTNEKDRKKKKLWKRNETKKKTETSVIIVIIVVVPRQQRGKITKSSLQLTQVDFMLHVAEHMLTPEMKMGMHADTSVL